MPKSAVLRVIRSSIETCGWAKLCPPAFEDLGLRPGDVVTVQSGDRTITLQAYPDPIYVDGAIRLTALDIEALGTEEGARVVVFAGEPSPVEEPKPRRGRKRRRK
ncbi:MAG: hypothetical protein AB1665_03855 [Candidatus Thermoplasmatota archaeon]